MSNEGLTAEKLNKGFEELERRERLEFEINQAHQNMRTVMFFGERASKKGTTRKKIAEAIRLVRSARRWFPYYKSVIEELRKLPLKETVDT